MYLHNVPDFWYVQFLEHYFVHIYTNVNFLVPFMTLFCYGQEWHRACLHDPAD
jgi:hypothetical protein